MVALARAALALALEAYDRFRSHLPARPEPLGALSPVQASAQPRVLRAVLGGGADPRTRSLPGGGLQALEAIGRFTGTHAALALFDAPWTPLFIGVLFIFHPVLGWAGVGAAGLLVALAALQRLRTRRLEADAQGAAIGTVNTAEQLHHAAPTVVGLGMRPALLDRLVRMRTDALRATLGAADRVGAHATMARTLRLYLQSMMLGLGAWLAIHGAITPGVMIAATILLGRALAPIDQVVAQWSVMQRALEAWRVLRKLPAEPVAPALLALPAPDVQRLKATRQPLLAAQHIVAASPGVRHARLKGVFLQLHPGSTIGIVGPSGAGKSTLARVLAGVWPAAEGRITLAGVRLAQYGDDLARHLGWLDQDARLLPGTVAENIARFDPHATAPGILEAARRAGAHEAIVALAQGYATEVPAGEDRLSAGERKRIALARAFYGNPPVLVLDDPEAHLDGAAIHALAATLKAHAHAGGGTIVVTDDRRVLAACDVVHVLWEGRTQPAARTDPSGRTQAVASRAGGSS